MENRKRIGRKPENAMSRKIGIKSRKTENNFLSCRKPRLAKQLYKPDNWLKSCEQRKKIPYSTPSNMVECVVLLKKKQYTPMQCAIDACRMGIFDGIRHNCTGKMPLYPYPSQSLSFNSIPTGFCNLYRINLIIKHLDLN